MPVCQLPEGGRLSMHVHTTIRRGSSRNMPPALGAAEPQARQPIVLTLFYIYTQVFLTPHYQDMKTFTKHPLEPRLAVGGEGSLRSWDIFPGRGKLVASFLMYIKRARFPSLSMALLNDLLPGIHTHGHAFTEVLAVRYRCISHRRACNAIPLHLTVR